MIGNHFKKKFSKILRQDEWLATLSELEVMDKGQIIRHVLGTQGTLPLSGKALG